MTADIGVVFSAAHTRGGVERVAWEVVRRLASRHTVEFIGKELQATESSARFRQVMVPPGSQATEPRRFRKAAASLLTTGRPTTLLSFGVNCPPGDVYWVQSVHRAWLESGSSVSMRGIPVPSFARRLLRRHRILLELERDYFVRHQPRAIMCTSAREVDDLIRLYGVDDSLLHVVPNGFDSSRFNPERRQAQREQMRQRLGMRETDLSLLFAVNELHRKGFAVLLEAVARLRDHRVRIDVVGRASIAPFSAQIDRLGLSQRVYWHGSTSAVEDFHASADLLVLPTQYEPFGLVIIEALGSGLPVITTQLAGAAPAVPGAGLLQADPHDIDELAWLLTQGLDEHRRQAWALAGPRNAAPYKWERVVQCADEILNPA